MYEKNTSNPINNSIRMDNLQRRNPTWPRKSKEMETNKGQFSPISLIKNIFLNMLIPSVYKDVEKYEFFLIYY